MTGKEFIPPEGTYISRLCDVVPGQKFQYGANSGPCWANPTPATSEALVIAHRMPVMVMIDADVLEVFVKDSESLDWRCGAVATVTNRNEVRELIEEARRANP